MQLNSLQLINFRNYAEARVSFSPKINVLVGKNGSGKTNLLDAIYYLSMTKSAVSSADNYCIRNGEQQFFIRGMLQMGEDIREVSVGCQAGTRKIFREGVNEYQKISDHIGKYPVVLIAPDDTDLIREGSDARRRFFDSMISQLDRVYLESLIQYTHALKQRNGLLKLTGGVERPDPVALETYDDLLNRYGSVLFEKRTAFAEVYIPVFRKYYEFLVSGEETGLLYKSDLHDLSFGEGLRRNHGRDLALQRTTFGVHRDDYHFSLDGGDLKRLGSQGQQKSFVIALKLAQFDVMRREKGFAPVLLLDDIFDKLDDLRIERLLQLIKNDELGQLFVTDARPDRTAALLQQIDVPALVYEVSGGKLKEA